MMNKDREPDGDLKWGGVCHAALFALSLIVLQLEADRITATVTERDNVLIKRAAMMAKHVARVEGIRLDRGTAATAS
jgi:hypothetical protein